MHWGDWDRSGDLEDWQLPEEEPEDYVLQGEHSVEAAAALGDLWELVPLRQRLPWKKLRSGERVVVWSMVDDKSVDFFAFASALLLVSDEARRWLEDRVAEWIQFTEIHVV